jgi:replicative DNA helicase
MTAAEILYSKQDEAEKAVLGAILIDPESYHEAAGMITPDDFGYIFHKIIFGKFGEVIREKGTFDLVLLMKAIPDGEHIDENGKKEYLMRLADDVPVLGNLKHYCDLVKQRSVGRKAIEILRNADFRGITGANISETVQDAANKLSDLVRDKGRAKIQGIRDVLQDIYRDIFEETEDSGIGTGFWMLDKLLDGIYPGDLITIGAETSVGKTAFALQILTNMARKGKKVMIYSQEMTAKQNIQRIISRISGVEVKQLRRKDRTTEEEKKKILEAFDTTHKYFINISADGGLRVSDIALDCVKNNDLDIICIDHIGLMRGEKGANHNRSDELSKIMTGLRALALQINKPIIALAQLNREIKPDISRKGIIRNSEPQLHHFKGSSEIEQSSSSVIFLWRLPEYEEKGMIGVKIAKNRQGENGKLYMKFDAPRMDFREVMDYNPPTGFTAAGSNELEEMFL